MRKPLLRIAAGLVGGLVAALAVAPGGLAFAATGDVTEAKDVIALDEAWFFQYRQPLAPVPDFDDPTNNNPDDIAKAEVRSRTNPYPIDTLHVGVNGGEPEAELFLAWDTLTLNGNNGLSAIIAGGTVTFTDAGSTCISTVPDSAPEEARPERSCGSRNAEAADMIACPATSLIIEAQGGNWEDRYDYDDKDCAPLEPVEVAEGKPLQWTLKLDQWAERWSDPFDYYGLAVIPNPEVEAPAPEEWHVAFHGRRTDAEEPVLIAADLKIIKQEIPDFGGPTPPPPPPPPDDSGETPTYTPSPSSGTTPGSYTPSSTSGGSPTYTPPTTSTSTIPSSTTVPDSTTSAPAAQAAPPAATGATVAAPPTTPTAAPAVQTPMAIWLLPVLGLSLAGALGWSLTQPVQLTAEREGAVSKLMKARRLGRA